MWPDSNVRQPHTGELSGLLKTTAFEEVSSSQISCVPMEPMFPGVCVGEEETRVPSATIVNGSSVGSRFQPEI